MCPIDALDLPSGDQGVSHGTHCLSERCVLDSEHFSRPRVVAVVTRVRVFTLGVHRRHFAVWILRRENGSDLSHPSVLAAENEPLIGCCFDLNRFEVRLCDVSDIYEGHVHPGDPPLAAIEQSLHPAL